MLQAMTSRELDPEEAQYRQQWRLWSSTVVNRWVS